MFPTSLEEKISANYLLEKDKIEVLQKDKKMIGFQNTRRRLKYFANIKISCNFAFIISTNC